MKSWNQILLESERDVNFSPRNLPYGVVIATRDANEPLFLATRLGNYVIKLANFAQLAIPPPPAACNFDFLMRQGKAKRVQFRHTLQHCLFAPDSRLHTNTEFLSQTCLPITPELRMGLPCTIGDYTDFYASRNHAENVGHMYRGKDAALQPNWLHLPVAYHGRASSIVCSPSTVVRPMGQQLQSQGGGGAVVFAPTAKLDFELEVGIFVGGEENALGTRLSVTEARDRIFGLILLNDWSARDVQTWEYVPLGPFCAKNFCTTISAWIIPIEALDACCKAAPINGQPHSTDVLEHLRDDEYMLYDIQLFAAITRASGGKEKEAIVCETNLRNLYWTPAQMMAHHTSTGCNLRAGDLLGTGTISGPEPSSFASLLELTWNGTKGDGFLRDGDAVRMFGHTRGGTGIGFGDCIGRIVKSKL